LNRLPLDVLKLDQAFVRNMHRDEGAATIVKAILALAKSLKLSVVAEGVETEAQRKFLESHGCDYAQGYLIGAAVPANEGIGLARRGNPRLRERRANP